MADKTIKIKIEFEGDSTNAKAAAEEVKTALDKVDASGKETSKGFGLMDTQIGKSAKGIVDMAKKGVASMTTLKGAIISTGIGALLIAVMGVVNWFKKTETGADLLAKASKILGQIIKEGPMAVFNGLKIAVLALLIPLRTAISTFTHMKEVLAGRESLKDAIQGIKEDVKGFGQEIGETAGKFKQMGKNIADAGRLADAWDKLEDARRERKVADAELEAKIADLREKAFDQDTALIERKQALLDVEKLLASQYAINKADKEQEIANINEELRLYPDNQDWIEKLATAKVELADIDRQYSRDKKLLNRQMVAVERQTTADQKKELEERAKAQEEHLKRLRTLQQENDLLSAENDDERARIKLEQDRDNQLAETKNTEELLLIWANYWLKLGELEESFKEKKEKSDEEKRKNERENEKQHKQYLLDLERTYQESKYNAVNSALSLLNALTGKNREFAYAALLLEKGVAIARVIIEMTKANAAARAGAIAFGAPGGPVGMAISLAATAPIINANRIAAILNVATIVAEAEKGLEAINSAGKEKKALGGWLGGPSHQDGGINIIGEGGEYIVNKRTMANPYMAQSIVAMNEAGNTGGISGMLTEERVAEIAAKVVSSIPVYVLEQDITTKQRKVALRESRFVQ